MIHSRKRFQNRAGFTLVHQVIFIAMMPVILIAATTWVHESMKMSSRFKHLRESHVVMNHLANQIQNDVHSSKSSNFNSELKQIELTGHDGQKVAFKIDGGEVQKTATVNGEVVSRESYRLSEEYYAEWDADAMEENPERVTLKVFRYPNFYGDSAPESLVVLDPKLEFVITAKANRWKRSIVFGRETKPTSEVEGEK